MKRQTTGKTAKKTTATKRTTRATTKRTTKHPGFKAEAEKIAKRERVSVKRADAMLAASTRKDSSRAKKKNPRLKKVKGT